MFTSWSLLLSRAFSTKSSSVNMSVFVARLCPYLSLSFFITLGWPYMVMIVYSGGFNQMWSTSWQFEFIYLFILFVYTHVAIRWVVGKYMAHKVHTQASTWSETIWHRKCKIHLLFFESKTKKSVEIFYELSIGSSSMSCRLFLAIPRTTCEN